MWGARHRKMGETKKKILVRSSEKNGRGKLPRIALERKPIEKRAPGRPPKRWKDSWQSISQELIQKNLQN